MIWFSEEQVAAWQSALAGIDAEAPVELKKPVPLRCDSCKRFISSFNTYLLHADVRCHLTEKCLEKFRIKHFKYSNFHKQDALVNPAKGIVYNV